MAHNTGIAVAIPFDRQTTVRLVQQDLTRLSAAKFIPSFVSTAGGPQQIFQGLYHARRFDVCSQRRQPSGGGIWEETDPGRLTWWRALTRYYLQPFGVFCGL